MDVCKQAFHQEIDEEEEDEEDSGVSPRDVGHNIYILAHQVCVNSRHAIGAVAVFRKV